MGKNNLIDPKNEIRTEEENVKLCKKWATELLPYDAWFETEEFLTWAKKEWPKGGIENAVQQSITESKRI
jgi:hypothetical protein